MAEPGARAARGEVSRVALRSEGSSFQMLSSESMNSTKHIMHRSEASARASGWMVSRWYVRSCGGMQWVGLSMNRYLETRKEA